MGKSLEAKEKAKMVEIAVCINHALQVWKDLEKTQRIHNWLAEIARHNLIFNVTNLIKLFRIV